MGQCLVFCDRYTYRQRIRTFIRIMAAVAAAGALLTLLLQLVVTSHGYVISPPNPVPVTEPGIRYKPQSVIPPVKLEAFFEIHCPDSLTAWPIMKSVLDYYGPNKLDLVIQQLPLPYHRNAFLATQGLYVIEKEMPNKVFEYMEANLNNWSNFTTANTVSKTEYEVLDMLADLAFTSTGIDRNLFKSTIGNYQSYTVSVWKYGVRRANAATPTFWTNGVELGCGTTIPTFDEWIAFLDPIIAARQ